jgi:peroxiredoxin
MVRMTREWFAALVCVPWLAVAAPPDLVLPDADGRPRSVREFIGRGQWTVVAVWSADCPICRRELYHVAFFHDEHRARDAAVLGLSVDGPGSRAKARAFIDEQALNFPNLIGTPADAVRLAGKVRFVGTPTFYFFTPQGEFAAQRIGAMTQAQLEELLSALATARAARPARAAR